ncbi:RNA polymerase subunit sigma [Nocardia sp. MDA0666]|uniref:RNA polymerase sigma-70 factor (ECF subfamily) n=1 Tax=Nocardia kruczakiae TaxID=261477 RepID=A0ABU1XA74_9NOCA|nr:MULTISPECIES: sigma-70 family RNA polymerase sigma factor [Nocardia]MDR7167445.1 RNA polymerase sigma-70 factor (ECF subfamily) [Nocardia kruczakiae]PSR69209.1 RNA polymerase subunit sigma [Nocardia sp. MDA0666]
MDIDQRYRQSSSTTITAAELATLLHKSAAGDAESFAAFYRSTNARLMARLTAILRSPGLAQEVSQEVYLQAWSAAGDYDAGRASPMAWLMMFAHRRAVDRVRSEQSLADRERAFGRGQYQPECDVVFDEVTQRLDERSVAGEVHRLGHRQREAILLAFYGGRTYPEVAQDLGIPLPTAKARIRAGLKTLGSRLSEKSRDEKK